MPKSSLVGITLDKCGSGSMTKATFATPRTFNYTQWSVGTWLPSSGVTRLECHLDHENVKRLQKQVDWIF